MKKAVKIICFSVFALLTLTLAVLTAVFAKRAFRPVQSLVLVDDALFNSYADFFKPQDVNEQDELPFTFVTKSQTAEIPQGFFSPIAKQIAMLTLENSSALFPDEQQEAGVHFFELETWNLVPSVKADYTRPSAAENSLLSPKLSVSISTVEDMPDGNRALPVDGKYAGSKDYPLLLGKRIRCTVFEPSVEQILVDWCTEHFSSDKVSLGSEEPVFIASVGDIMVARGAQDILLNQKDGLSKVFGTTLPLLQDSDFTIGNLEGVVTESWKNATKTYTFKFKKAVLPELLKAGFDYLMQTNNHCYDYGEAGFKDTLAAFKEYSVPTSGVGYNKEEASKFYNTQVKGQNLAVISCGAFPVEQSGFNGKTTATATETRAGILWENPELLKEIKKQKEAGNFVIVNVHGGEEYHFSPSKSQRKLYQSFCDNGADIVFGSHPHVLQPTEWYGRSLIVYSMGNFVFNGMEGMNGATDSEVVRVGVSGGRIAYVEQYPARLSNCTVTLK